VLVLAVAVCVLVVAFVFIAPHLGSEFVPTLSEGAIEIGITRPPDTPIERTIEDNTRIEQAILKALPDEVSHVWSRIGTAEVATDPMGLGLTDMFISLTPRQQWTRAKTQAEVTDLVRKELRPFLGGSFSFSQPIKERMDEMISGVRADVVVKIFGDDLGILKKKAGDVEEKLKSIAGNKDVLVPPIAGVPVLQIKIKQDESARHGVPAKAILDLVESLGGMHLGDVVDGQFRFPLVIRLPEKYRGTRSDQGEAKSAIERLPVLTAKGERLPLSRLAQVDILDDSPSTINREWGRRCVIVKANVERRERDLGSFVAEAQSKITAAGLGLSGRYHIEWSGQWEQLIHASQRFLWVGALTLVLIISLIYVAYGDWLDTLRVLVGIPFGAVGGIVALWLRGMPFSISAAIGFIAMAGVAVLDDMILVSYVRQLRRKGLGIDAAVRQAAITRLRPVLMTTLVASLGFVPMAFSTGMGAEVQRPLATVVIGGVISAMVMSLFVVRVLYVVFRLPVRTKPREEAEAEQARSVGAKLPV
jgi:cobalt-zinc-cadmium resistance protein CzcA